MYVFLKFMGTDVSIGEVTIKYDGIFSFKDAYELLHNLLDDKSYSINETEYKEAQKPKGKEIEITWEASKKVDDYTKFKIKIKWKVDSLVEVTVKQGDETLNKNKGKIKIKFSATLIKDYDDKWKTPMLKLMQGMFEKYIYGSTLKQWKSTLSKEMYDLYNEMKAFFDVEKLANE